MHMAPYTFIITIIIIIIVTNIIICCSNYHDFCKTHAILSITKPTHSLNIN